MLTGVQRFPAERKAIGGSKWGYIDRYGKWVIPDQFDYANPFQSNGLAIVEAKGKTGVINRSGKYVIEPKYDWIAPFSEGRAVVNNQDGYIMINERGRPVTKKTYDYIGTAHEGRAVFLPSHEGDEQSKYGYLDLQGNEVIAAQYAEAEDFGEHGQAVVRLSDTEHALIDRKGNVLHKYPYADVGPLSEGLLSFRKHDSDPAGFTNVNGEIVIPAQYVLALPFEEGRAIVNVSSEGANEYGMIDRNGNIVIPAKYHDIRMMGEQRVAVGKAIDKDEPFRGSIYAIANLMGGFLTDFTFQSVGMFEDGIASVSNGVSTFFIDRNGQKRDDLVEVEGNGMLTPMGDLVQANVDQRLSYYTKFGELVWKQNEEISLRPPLKVVEYRYKPNVDYLVYYPQIKGMEDAKIQHSVNQKLKEMSIVPITNGEQTHSYTGDFNVTYFHKDLLVIQLNGYDYPFGAAHGMPSMRHVHINVKAGQFYKLEQLFKPGSDYVKAISEIVGKQIEEDPQYDYVFPDSFQGISPDQPFYVKEDALYVYFPPYEIAPYVAGFPTFRIPFEEIIDLIDRQGDFWTSFHP